MSLSRGYYTGIMVVKEVGLYADDELGLRQCVDKVHTDQSFAHVW